MQIHGMPEFERVRKALQKEGQKKPPAPAPEAPAGGADVSDAAEVSGPAKMLGKLHKIPDIRRQKIEQVLAKAERGELLTPEAVKESLAKMIDGLI